MITLYKALNDPTLQVRFLCNLVDMNSSIRTEIREALLAHETLCPTLEHHLCRRVIYRRSINGGESVLASDDKRAIDETTQVASEIKAVLNDLEVSDED